MFFGTLQRAWLIASPTGYMLPNRPRDWAACFDVIFEHFEQEAGAPKYSLEEPAQFSLVPADEAGAATGAACGILPRWVGCEV